MVARPRAASPAEAEEAILEIDTGPPGRSSRCGSRPFTQQMSRASGQDGVGRERALDGRGKWTVFLHPDSDNSSCATMPGRRA